MDGSTHIVLRPQELLSVAPDSTINVCSPPLSPGR